MPLRLVFSPAERERLGLPRQQRRDVHLVHEMDDLLELLLDVAALVAHHREGKASLKDSYAAVKGDEVWLLHCHISPYTSGGYLNHDPLRARRLLLGRDEIEKLSEKTAERGLTLIPTRIYFKGPYAKVELALARNKEQRDRRREIRDRDVQREVERDYRQRLR